MTFPLIDCSGRYFLLAAPICLQNRNVPFKRVRFPSQVPASLSSPLPCMVLLLLWSAVELPLQFSRALSSFSVTPQTTPPPTPVLPHLASSISKSPVKFGRSWCCCLHPLLHQPSFPSASRESRSLRTWKNKFKKVFLESLGIQGT